MILCIAGFALSRWSLTRTASYCLVLAMGFCLVPQSLSADEGTLLRAMTWNIWHGGREDGDQVGPQRVVDVIRDSGADVVAMQETYGSGEKIAAALQYHFHPRGTNVSILSRFPVVEDLSVGKEFQCVGALLQLPEQQQVAFFSIWLPYDAEIWESGTRDPDDVPQMLAACESSAIELRAIWKAIDQRLSDPKYAQVPIVIAGDFNSMSHRDYAAVAVDQYRAIVNWPTSRVLSEVGFRDSYRDLNPVIDRNVDRTWTPRFKDQEQDRIDFVYYRATEWRATESRVIDRHADGFPSDHAALLTTLKRQTVAAKRTHRVMSYNIKHGRGMDGRVDLQRVGNVLKKQDPDFIGLQEVDRNASRSGNVNQAKALARQLKMHPAFGAFMDFQGGQYGMAVLSKYPVKRVVPVKLPAGGEPRIALAVEVQLPQDESLMLVNVHFDWVSDDTVRFAQAKELRKYLDGLTVPYILLGDFNDRPGTRTLNVLSAKLRVADKPGSDRFTFSSTEPRIEIDFLMASPRERWQVDKVQVIEEPLASDHRPVVAEFTLQGE